MNEGEIISAQGTDVTHRDFCGCLHMVNVVYTFSHFIFAANLLGVCSNVEKYKKESNRNYIDFAQITEQAWCRTGMKVLNSGQVLSPFTFCLFSIKIK